MKDILGRELKDGDVCVGKGTGRDVRGMDVGIWHGKSIAFKGGNHRSMGDVFLVVNPSEAELNIKKEIEDALAAKEAERKKKNSKDTIPLSKLEVGGIYRATNGLEYLYLGMRRVILKDLYRNLSREEVGNCFVHVYSNESEEAIKNRILTIRTYRGEHNISVLKWNKKLTELTEKINLEFPMKKEFDNHKGYYSPYHYELIVE